MNVLDKVEKTAIRDVLGKDWLTHDGMWFSNTYREFGIEKANELNKKAIRSLAPIEIGRMKQLLGVAGDHFETFDDLARFMAAGLELTLPHSVFKQLRLTPSAGNVLRWKWEDFQCFAYKGMKQNGVIDGYNCGVMYRIECWLEFLNVRYAMQPAITGCLMYEKGTCEGEICILS